MATAFAMLETYSSFRESLSGAAEKAKAAAERARAAVVEQTKVVVEQGKTLSSSSFANRARELVGLLNDQASAAADSLDAAEQGGQPGAQQGGAQKPGQQQQQQQGQGKGQGQDAKAGTPPRQPSTSGSSDASQPLLEELSNACNLTFKQRVYGFASCLSLGLLCCVLSLFVLFHPVKFGLAYSLGNLLALGSTGFLIGFKRQATMMFDPVRRVAAVVFVVMVFVTLLCALLTRDPLLSLVCILIQGSALLWYSLSYIPYAQSAAKRMARMFFSAEF